MQSIIDYFTTIPSSHRTLLLVGGITFFWVLESTLPLFHHEYGKWKHAGINFFFTFTTILVNFLLAFILVGSSAWVVAHEFGLMQWVDLPISIEAVVGLMLLDLIGAYLAHLVQHRTPVLWRFHLIHHTDQHLGHHFRQPAPSGRKRRTFFLYHLGGLSRRGTHLARVRLPKPERITESVQPRQHHLTPVAGPSGGLADRDAQYAPRPSSLSIAVDRH